MTQLPEENGQQRRPTRRRRAQPENPELSEAFRALLGLGEEDVKPAQANSAARVQPLMSDPWNSLSNARGFELIDLQKVHLHDPQGGISEDEVEHALDVMQEAPRQDENKPSPGHGPAGNV